MSDKVYVPPHFRLNGYIYLRIYPMPNCPNRPVLWQRIKDGVSWHDVPSDDDKGLAMISEIGKRNDA